MKLLLEHATAAQLLQQASLARGAATDLVSSLGAFLFGLLNGGALRIYGFRRFGDQRHQDIGVTAHGSPQDGFLLLFWHQ